MNIQKNYYQSNSLLGTMQIMKRMCRDFKSDLSNDNRTPEQIYKYLQSIYNIEKGEIIQRPKVTDQLKTADCDCQCVYATCYFLNKIDYGNIWWILCGNKGLTHIYPVFQIDYVIYRFDMLPKRKLNQDYKYNFIEIWEYKNI